MDITRPNILIRRFAAGFHVANLVRDGTFASRRHRTTALVSGLHARVHQNRSRHLDDIARDRGAARLFSRNAVRLVAGYACTYGAQTDAGTVERSTLTAKADTRGRARSAPVRATSICA